MKGKQKWLEKWRTRAARRALREWGCCVMFAGKMREMAMRVLSLVVSVAIAMGVALAIVAGAMTVADRMGWIEHRRTANVVASANWTVGEEKSCALQGGMQTPTLVCDEGAPEQRVKVVFRGPLHATAWRCTRGGEAVECEAK
jgi:hypothetical protein